MNTHKNSSAASCKPGSPCIADCVKAFISGGTVCCIGEMLFGLWSKVTDPVQARAAVSVSLIAAAQLLTGLGVFDKLARFCGGGLLLPITGFANSIASPAMEFRKEGIIFGLMAKMFVIAGPVIVTGVVSSVIVGAIYRIIAVV